MFWLLVGLALVGGTARAAGRAAEGSASAVEGVGIGAVVLLAFFVAGGTAVLMAGFWLGEVLGTNAPLNDFALATIGVDRPADVVQDCDLPGSEQNQPWRAIAFFVSLPIILIGGIVMQVGLFFAIPVSLVAIPIGALVTLPTRDSRWITYAGGALLASVGAITVAILGYRFMMWLHDVGCPM